MRLARSLLGLLLLSLAAKLYVIAEALLRASAPTPVLPWRSAVLLGIAAARIVGAFPVW